MKESRAQLFKICGKTRDSQTGVHEGPNESDVGEVLRILKAHPELAKWGKDGQTPLHVLATNPKAFDFVGEIPGQRDRTTRIIKALVAGGAGLSSVNKTGVRVEDYIRACSDSIKNQTDRIDPVSGKNKADVIIGIISEAEIEKAKAFDAVKLFRSWRDLGIEDVLYDAAAECKDGAFELSICTVNTHKTPGTNVAESYSTEINGQEYRFSVDEVRYGRR